jgi:hypothetical protein
MGAITTKRFSVLSMWMSLRPAQVLWLKVASYVVGVPRVVDQAFRCCLGLIYPKSRRPCDKSHPIKLDKKRGMDGELDRIIGGTQVSPPGQTALRESSGFFHGPLHRNSIGMDGTHADESHRS